MTVVPLDAFFLCTQLRTVIQPCDFSRNPAKNRVTRLPIIRTVG
jgi:hypothetical protein